VSAPVTKPRCAKNQRFATLAASTVASIPTPTPASRPHETISCQLSREKPAQKTAAAMMHKPSTIVFRNPYVCISAAANGPTAP
jgi:hypothetical protein